MTSPEDFDRLQSAMSRAVKSKQILVKSTGERIPPMTVSVGIAGFRGAETAEAVLKTARACLLGAKAAGRDRIITDLQLKKQSAA